MSKKLNHIKFLKLLVCPDDVRQGIIPFKEWCDVAIEEKSKYLEQRTLMVLDFYLAFKRLYKYTKKNLEDDIISNITCDMDTELFTLTVYIKYDKALNPTALINDAKEYFMEKDGTHYNIKSITRSLENPNVLTITFYKKE